MPQEKTLSRRRALGLAAGSLAAGLGLFRHDAQARDTGALIMKFFVSGDPLGSIALPEKVAQALKGRKPVEGRLYFKIEADQRPVSESFRIAEVES